MPFSETTSRFSGFLNIPTKIVSFKVHGKEHYRIMYISRLKIIGQCVLDEQLSMNKAQAVATE